MDRRHADPTLSYKLVLKMQGTRIGGLVLDRKSDWYDTLS